jgi:hypothetical protein
MLTFAGLFKYFILLTKLLSMVGGFVDDFLSNLMCCCCALVQEWREVEIRGVSGMSSYFSYCTSFNWM